MYKISFFLTFKLLFHEATLSTIFLKTNADKQKLTKVYFQSKIYIYIPHRSVIVTQLLS